MVYDVAVGAGTAGPWTRVPTFFPHTGEVAGALGVDGTFWSTVGRRTGILRKTRTGRRPTVVSALGIRSAWRREARVDRHRSSLGRGWRYGTKAELAIEKDVWYSTPKVYFAKLKGLFLTWNPETPGERVSREPGTARADRAVIDDLALGILTASARARVHALLVDASLVGGAFSADDALRSAARRGADVLRKTGAYRLAVVHLALAVGAAGRRVARINGRSLDGCGDHNTKNKRQWDITLSRKYSKSKIGSTTP